ncbi:HIT family protein [Nocardiopsis sp. NPDC007018]|uniref:HIT family protein n=1 Tax=Nocardiopsis sp. NPDC007018 TaxID=3155721 RepID=UPI0033E60720
MTCVFCQIIDGQEPAEIVRVWDDALAIVPLAPLTPGHVLVIPRIHVADAAVDPVITAITARRAAQLLRPGHHLGLNTGAEAGQTVFHLHLHLWPCQGDQRCMPWGCPQ